MWAFDVTMWEIFTLAKEQPYNDMSDKQVVEDALKGKNRTKLDLNQLGSFSIQNTSTEVCCKVPI